MTEPREDGRDRLTWLVRNLHRRRHYKGVTGPPLVVLRWAQARGEDPIALVDMWMDEDP